MKLKFRINKIISQTRIVSTAVSMNYQGRIISRDARVAEALFELICSPIKAGWNHCERKKQSHLYNYAWKSLPCLFIDTTRFHQEKCVDRKASQMDFIEITGRTWSSIEAGDNTKFHIVISTNPLYFK